MFRSIAFGGNPTIGMSIPTDSSYVPSSSATGQPGITGTAQEDATLTATIGTIADSDGLPLAGFPAGYTFQWKRSGANISGATASTYVLTQADVGETITVAVSFTDQASNAEGPLESTATGTVLNVNDPPTGS